VVTPMPMQSECEVLEYEYDKVFCKLPVNISYRGVPMPMYPRCQPLPVMAGSTVEVDV